MIQILSSFARCEIRYGIIARFTMLLAVIFITSLSFLNYDSELQAQTQSSEFPYPDIHPGISPGMQYKNLPYNGDKFPTIPKSTLFKNSQVSWQNPQPQGNSFLGISFVDENLGWAVGARGTILSTADGGKSWNHQNGGTLRWFADVDFYNESIGWIVGESGTVLHTMNAGAAWAEQDGQTDRHLAAVYFRDLRTGWAVGDEGAIISTSDGGVNWLIRNSRTDVWLSDVFFVTNTRGWAVGDSGTILSSSDGGVNWSRIESGTSNSLSSVYFTNGDSGWAVGEAGTVLQTIDGGTTWSKKTISTGHRLNKIFFLDSRIGWICGWYGTLFKTDNNGETWTKISSGTRDDIEDIQFTDIINGFAAGAWGTILKTIESGFIWESVTSRWTSEVLYGVAFTDSASGWAVGDKGAILHTADGGIIWNSQTSGTAYLLRDVFFLNAATGWAVGDSGVILKTSTGGASWSAQTSGTKSFLSSVFFLDGLRGWIAGSAGTILYSSDGGANWTLQETEFYSRNAEWLSDIFFIDELTGWAVGREGTILLTGDGGISWNESRKILTGAEPDSAGTDSTSQGGDSVRWSLHWLLSVRFVDAEKGWAVGGYGTILHSTDGGINWLEQKNDDKNWTNAWLYNLAMMNEQYGWAAGGDSKSGILLRTTDGGLTWTNYESGSASSFYGLAAYSPSRGWAVGRGGSIITFHTPELNLENRITSRHYAAYRLNTGVSAAVSFTDSFVVVHPADSTFSLHPGDEIGFSNQDGINAGGGYFSDSYTIVTVWGDDPQTPAADGFTEGDYMSVRLWADAQKLEYRAIPQYGTGSANFIPDGLSKIDILELSGFQAGQPARQYIPADESEAGIFFENNLYIRLSFLSGNAPGNSITFVSYGDTLELFDSLDLHPRKALNIMHVSLDNDVPYEAELIAGYSPADSMGMIDEEIRQADLTIAYFDSLSMKWIRVDTEIDSAGSRAVARFNSAYSLWMLADGTDDIITRVKEDNALLPDHFSLSQNFPNPFNPVTTIRYSLPAPSAVNLKVYNILGQEIAAIVNEVQQAGQYTIQWNGKNTSGISVPSGIYFYRLSSGDFSAVRKMLLLR